MNKLIRDIAIQTDAWCDQNGSVKAAEWEEKFAKLIVQECADFLMNTMDDHFAAEQLIEHFGVEE
jgi:hypothetical protein